MKYNPTLRRRIGAAALMLSIFINLFRLPLPAAAAETGFKVSFSQTLIPGVDNAVPRFDKNRLEEQALLSWPMNSTTAGRPFDYGSYKLSYYVDDGEKAEFTVRKNGGSSADVWFDSLVLSGGALTTKAPFGYEVHSNVKGQGLPHFLPIQLFLDGGYNTSDPNYQVVSGGALKAYADLRPHFKIGPDRGFSFHYNNTEIHFLWNSADQRMYYVTNRMVTGRIFNMVLEHTYNIAEPPDFTTKTAEGSLKVLTGVSTRTFRAIPFANAIPPADPLVAPSDKDRNTAEGFCLDFDPDLRKYARYLDMGEGVTDTNPGSPVNELFLRFDVPKEYDETTDKFSVLPDYPLPASITMNNLIPKNELQITVSDLRSPIPGFTLNTNDSASIMNDSGWVDAGGERFGIHLTNTNPGQLFNRVSVGVTGKGIESASVNIPFGTTFTFLKYEVVTLDGQFYVSIDPYPGYTGYYMLKSGMLESSHQLKPAVTMYSDGKSPLLMPLVINSANKWEAYYQIFFSPEQKFADEDTSKSIYTQQLHYKADVDKLTAGAPNNFKILNGYKLIAKPGSVNNQQADLEFTARWDIGDQQIIDYLVERSYPEPLVIKYLVNRSLTPNNSSPDLFDTVELTITSSQGLYVEYSDSAGKVLNTARARLASRTESGGGKAAYTYYAEVTFAAEAALKDVNLQTGAKVDFFYPNIYFLNVKPVTVNGAPVNITASLFDSMTLNDISKLEVPPPQSFTVRDPVISAEPEEISFKASFILPGAKIADFISAQALYVEKNVTANLYVCQDEGRMREQFMPLDYAGRVKSSVNVPYNPDYGSRLYFSGINGHTPMAIAAPDYKDARDALRKGKVVRISDIGLTPEELDSLLNEGASVNMIFTLDGMDKNQKYFLCADIAVTERDAFGGIGVNEQSRPSNMAGITTGSNLETPGETEQIPPSPSLSVKDIGLSMVTILWNTIYPLSKNERIEYEIIRLKDIQLDNALLESRAPFEAFFAGSLPLNAQKAGWRTNLTVIEGYDGAAFTALDETKALYNPGFNPIEFTDYTLTPNQIYFYYVRTVRVIGGSRIVSAWSRVSVTSKPVAGPKNLKAEQGGTYDRMTEIVFSFDAPIIDKSLLGSAFNLQYQLQENSAQWQDPVTMDPSGLLDSPSQTAGFTHFMYKLSGLKPGALYAIRVRMVDSNGDGSIYSNVIQIKTDINQKSYDDARKSSEWIEYVKDLLKNLLKAPYWTTRDSGSAFEAVYRPDMFEGLIRAGAAPVLLAESKAGHTAYYLPASAILAANAAGKGIRIPHGDMEILLSPNALDNNYNDAVRSATDKIKTGHTADYYIKISVNWSSPHTDAGAENRRADVTITAIGSLADIRQWNNELMNKLAERVSDEVSDEKLLNYIGAGVEQNYRPERMVRFMDRVESAVNRELGFVAERDLRPTLRYAFPLTSVDEPIIIIAKNIDPRRGIQAYRYERGAWAPRSVKNFGDDRAVCEMQPGAYVFSARMTDLPGVRNTPSAGSKNAIAARYHLEDFFSRNVSMAATRFALAGASARIAGAPRDVEPYAWLRANMGLSLSSYGTANPVTQQEAVYIMMNLYAYKTRTDIGSLQKRDYTVPIQTQDIKDEYLPAVQAAFNLGLLKENSIIPNGTITEAQVMDMLRKLDEMIAL